MIKNERQYKITKAQAAKFENAFRETKAADYGSPLARKLHEDALASQLNELREDIAEYEALRDGEVRVLELHSLHELPQALIKARIAAGLSQKQLAERLGLKEQQIQKYEATDYAAANLERIGNVLDALGVSVRENLVIPAKVK